MEAFPKLSEKVLAYFELPFCNFSMALLKMLCSATSSFTI